MDVKTYKNQVYDIIGAAMEVHRQLGRGLLEAIYQEAMHYELLDRGIAHQREVDIKCYYKQHPLQKTYRADFMAGDVIVEMKSVSHLSADHRSQLCNYLRLTHKPLGLLINFGESRLVGERWAYDAVTRECYLIDQSMSRVFKP